MRNHYSSKRLAWAILLALLVCVGFYAFFALFKNKKRGGPLPPEYVTLRSLGFWSSIASNYKHEFAEIIKRPEFGSNRDIIYDELRAIVEEAGLPAYDWDNPGSSVDARFWSSARNRPVDGWGRPLLLVFHVSEGIIAVASCGEDGKWTQGFQDDRVILVANRCFIEKPH